MMIASAASLDESRCTMLPGSRRSTAAIERTVSATATLSNNGSASTVGACPMNRPWVAAAKILVAPASRQRRSSADQIIQDDDSAVTHVTDQEVTGDDAAAAPLFDECCRRLVMKFCRERPAELLGALGAADVRRDNGELFVP